MTGRPPPTREAVLTALEQVPDPCAAAAGLDLSIVDIGLVYDVTVDNDRVEISLTFTEPGCQFTHRVIADVSESVGALDGAGTVQVRPCWSPPWSPDRLSPRAVAALGAARRGYPAAQQASGPVLLQMMGRLGVDVLVPTSLAEVHQGLHEVPDARLLAGGTDLLVELRRSSFRPPAVLFIGQLSELRGWRRHNGLMELGAAVTLTELAGTELRTVFPALGAAARAVAGPQIRNAATLGGNLATAAPTSDLIPVLAALDATATIEGPDGRREQSVGFTADELGSADVVMNVRVPLRRGMQVYLRVGARRGMALPLAAVAVVVDLEERALRCAVGGCGRAVEAEQWVADYIDWSAGRVPDPRTYEGFGQLVAYGARPEGDRRASAAYRRHAVGVLARRALMELL